MSFKKKIIAATPMITLIAYLLIGFLADAWHPGWIVFFAIPIMPMILNPKGIFGMYPLLVVVVYLVLGCCFRLWHPWWILFLTIPVVEIFVPKKKTKKVYID